MCCLLNLCPSNFLSFSKFHNKNSASVGSLRIFSAYSFNKGYKIGSAKFLPSSPPAPEGGVVVEAPFGGLGAFFSSSIYGNKYATAFFITLADFTTCGKNILPSPNKSPTTFIPSMSGPSMTCSGFSTCWRASSTSISINSVSPLISACSRRLLTGWSRQALSKTCSLPFDFTVSANATMRSVESSRRLKSTSSQSSSISAGISLYTPN